MEDLKIRNEKMEDYKIVEEVTREAFWNIHEPGCCEHYLAHVIRGHEDFISELDYVAELDGKIIGSIMYTRAKLVDEKGEEKIILTFGPLSVLPAYQRKGVGKRLLEVSFKKALELGYDVIAIFGHPSNYVARGFKSCKKYNVCVGETIYPTALLVKELKPNVLDGRKWFYSESPAYEIDMAEAEVFDGQFAPKEKKELPCQEEFYIYSHSSIR